MKTMTLNEFQEALDEQPCLKADIKFVCCKCGHPQSYNDFKQAGVSDAETNGLIGFSCIGSVVEGVGCNWTCGGLFKIHKLEIEDDECKLHPHFLPQFMAEQVAEEAH